MSDNRQPTRPPTAQRRQATAATYPLTPITGKARWQPPAQPRTAAEVSRRPLTNYIAFTKDALDRWTFALHKGKTVTPMGMNGYAGANAAYQEALVMTRLQNCHILLTSDFLDELRAEWDAQEREAQATPRAWELA